MPHRRERQQTEGINGPAEPPVARPQKKDTVAQRLERCRAELLEKRQLESIQELKQELADGLCVSSIAVIDKESVTLLISYK
jgi:hypothetical protein